MQWIWTLALLWGALGVGAAAQQPTDRAEEPRERPIGAEPAKGFPAQWDPKLGIHVT